MSFLPIDAPAADTEFIILENIFDSSSQPLRQRELAQMAGASLGMTNSILKRLAKKGWITIKKLNSRNIRYAITLEGINEIIRRSYRYFKRTIRNVVYFKETLEDVISRAKRKNINTVILLGTSDLDFIVEHACRRLGMGFKKISENKKTGELPGSRTLIVYAEGITESFVPSPFTGEGTKNQGGMVSPQNSFYLSRLIIKQAAGLGLSGH